MLCRFMSSLVAVSILSVGAAAQDAGSLFEQGVQAFREGDNAAAAEALKAVLAANPSNEEAYQLLDRVENQTVMEMLLERGQLGLLTERFLGLAKVGRQSILSDPGGAEEVVARLTGGDATERLAATTELQGRYGEWAVPALVGALGDRSDIEIRVRAIQALIRLGDRAVVPLLAVLRAEDELTRTNAASVLGTLRDARAAAGLAWMASNDTSEMSRTVAAEALSRLRNDLDAMGLSTTDAMALTLGLAQRWLVGDPQLVKPYAAGQVVWSWQDGALVGEPILAGLYSLFMAQSALELALENGAGEPARAFLAAVNAAQKAEIEAASELEGLADSELLANAQATLGEIDLQLALAGRARGQALGQLLESGQVAAAQTLIAVMGSSVDEVKALRRALASADVGVATAAALNLGRQGDQSPAVVVRLGDALSSLPTRLVVAIGDTGLAGDFAGWQLMTSKAVAEGLFRAKAFPPKDVVVVQDGAQGVTLDALVFGLLNDPRTADVPIIVVTEDVDAVEALYADRVAKVVRSAGFADVAEVAGERTNVQGRAMARAMAAAEVLSGMPAGVASGVARSAAAALASGADDEVLVSVLGLVERAGLVGSLTAVEGVISSEPSRDVQVAAFDAAARLWGLNGGAAGATDGLLPVLRAALESGDDELALAAARALGQLGAVSSVAS